MKEFRVSNDALDQPDELRRRLADEGYLFLKKLQNPDRVLSLRRDVMQLLMEVGWLVDGTDPMDGIARIDAQCTEGDPEYIAGYHQIYRLQSFHEAGHWPEVLDVMTRAIGSQALPHPKKIARLWFPQYLEHTTPTHQDFVHFQGSFETYTFWAPIGDCPLELGGLALLPGSHKVDRLVDHHFSLGAGGLAIDDGELVGEWHSTDYEMGDALIFPSLTVHRALPNCSTDRLRISLDNRYQSLSVPISEFMLEPHLNGQSPLSWEDVYESWNSDESQYYWRDAELEVLPYVPEYRAKAFEESLELSRRGDKAAQYSLRRIARREPDSEAGQKASKVLSESPTAH
jgi:hypothetical protein